MRRLTANLYSVLTALPAFPGKVRLADVIGRIGSTLGDGHTSVCVGPGTQLDLDLRDRVQRQMWAGCYEPHVCGCLKAILRRGDVFLDVGAHVGYLTAIAARAVGPEGRVFAFEADPVMFQRLSDNVAQLPSVQAIHSAVWKESCPLVFERSSSNGESGWGTLTFVRDLGKGEHVTVDGVSLDDWSLRFPVDRIRVIKIDAEGSEVSILEGAQQTIARYRPILVVEMNDIILKQAGTSAVELATRLVQADYTLFGLTWLRVHQLVEGQAPQASEVLCVPIEEKEITLERVRAAGFKSC